MTTLISFRAAVAAVGLAAAAPAQALVAITYVSGKGADTGTCASPATPCRTFQYAHNQTSPGGEIRALDPVQYGSFVITKSISVIGVEGAGVTRSVVGDAISISAGVGGVVALFNLMIDGSNRIATNGIKLNSAASLTIRNCTVRRFSSHGVFLQPTTALVFSIVDAVAADNGNIGVYVFSQGVSARGVLNHVLAIKNSGGARTDTANGSVDVTANDSRASDNSGPGFGVGGGTTLRLSHSTATRNVYGVYVGGAATSAGDNFIDGNTIKDVEGALTNVGRK